MIEEQFKVVGHSLGINTYHAKLSERKKDKKLPEEFYRNYYCAGEPHGNYPILESLVEKGYMEKWVRLGNQYYSVTEEGVSEFRSQFKTQIVDTFVPPSKSKQNYLDYLHSDGCESFAEFLGIQKPKRETSYRDGGTRFVSSKYPEVKGEYKATIKEARESYKERLKKYKSKQVD